MTKHVKYKYTYLSFNACLKIIIHKLKHDGSFELVQSIEYLYGNATQ